MATPNSPKDGHRPTIVIGTEEDFWVQWEGVRTTLEEAGLNAWASVPFAIREVMTKSVINISPQDMWARSLTSMIDIKGM